MSRERRHLSIQEDVLGADGLYNRKRTTALAQLDANRGLRQLLRSVVTFQQSRFQVGFGDVVSVVSVNLNKTGLVSAAEKAHAQLIIYHLNSNYRK